MSSARIASATTSLPKPAALTPAETGRSTAVVSAAGCADDALAGLEFGILCGQAVAPLTVAVDGKLPTGVLPVATLGFGPCVFIIICARPFCRRFSRPLGSRAVPCRTV